MCLGIPARVVELGEHPDLVVADVFGAKRRINVGLIEGGVVPGDWVMLHVGFAIEKLDDEGVEAAVASLQVMGSAPDSDEVRSWEREEAGTWA